MRMRGRDIGRVILYPAWYSRALHPPRRAHPRGRSAVKLVFSALATEAGHHFVKACSVGTKSATDAAAGELLCYIDASYGLQ